MANDKQKTIDQWLGNLLATPKKLIFCRACLSPITDQAERIVIAQAHHHRFSNPAGEEYTIMCFAQAYGCTISGAPTSQACWFPSFHWQYASCSECNEQLGWYYENDSKKQFFGLISQRLAETLR